MKLGIGPEALCARNPRLIYAQASGWGRKGPEADALSFDYTGIARSGLMMAAGERGAPPSQILPGMGDEIGGLMCAWGVTAALYSREKTGKGQVVDTSLMGSIIGMLAFILAAPAMLGQEFSREIRAKAGNPLYNHYRCKDDKWIVIAHLRSGSDIGKRSARPWASKSFRRPEVYDHREERERTPRNWSPSSTTGSRQRPGKNGCRS